MISHQFWTPPVVIRALETLHQTGNTQHRDAMLSAGLKEMVKWFTLAAKLILQKKIKLPKQSLHFIEKNKQAIEQLADSSVSDETKRKIILKPGGSGFIGGVIIRNLLRWDGEKIRRKFGSPRRVRSTQRTSARVGTPKKRAGGRRRKRKTPAGGGSSTPKRRKTAKAPKRKTKKTSPYKNLDDRFVTRRRKSSSISRGPTPLPHVHNVDQVLDQTSPARSLNLSPVSMVSGFNTPSSHRSRRSSPLMASPVLHTPPLRHRGSPVHLMSRFSPLK